MSALLAAGRAEQRRALLDAALLEVPFEGWNGRTLDLAARSLGLTGADAQRLVPGGPVEVIDHWNQVADEAMRAALADRSEGLRTGEKVALAVRLRIEAQAGHKEAVRRALTVLALPGNAAVSARILYRTVDTIWFECGDTATDWNFYSKRALLAGVYASTVLFWLDDSSEGHVDSWAFMRRRLADVQTLPKALERLKSIGDRLPNPFLLVGKPFSRSMARR